MRGYFFYLITIIFQQWQHYNVSNLVKAHCNIMKNIYKTQFLAIFAYIFITWHFSYFEFILGSRNLLQILPPDFDSSLLTCRRLLQMQTYQSVIDTCCLNHLYFPKYVHRLYRFCFSGYARSNVRFVLLSIIWFMPIFSIL